ncbi:hypothetical protein E2C01_070119 [Portunus trituberculatus]|uniref:Uncharacterized protein n=1 Tax=Portunus trituberculatus TaxID=210409 RepID=A0A5B7I0Q7_PORTR|nr:hypothetical protein [Portunus trituberculatus]
MLTSDEQGLASILCFSPPSVEITQRPPAAHCTYIKGVVSWLLAGIVPHIDRMASQIGRCGCESVSKAHFLVFSLPFPTLMKITRRLNTASVSGANSGGGGVWRRCVARGGGGRHGEVVWIQEEGGKKSTTVSRGQLVCETRREITWRDKAEDRRLLHPLCSSAAYCFGSGRSAKRGGKVLSDPTKKSSRLDTPPAIESLPHDVPYCAGRPSAARQAGWAARGDRRGVSLEASTLAKNGLKINNL